MLMKSLRDIRLSNTSGHCINVVANEPKLIPKGLVQEALAHGMIEVEGGPELKTEPDPDPPKEMDAEERIALLDQAVLKVLTRNDEDDFKKDGTPKATKVIAELDPEFEPRPNATEILDAFERLQENFDLVED